VSISEAKHHSAQSIVQSALHDLVEGRREWGVIEIPQHVTRTGWDRYSLTVYPPGTNTAERRALTFLRRWPLGGALGVVIAELILGAIWPSAAVFAVLVGIYLVGLVTAFVRTNGLRRRVRRLVVAVVRVAGGVEVVGDRKLFEQSVSALEDLDGRMSAGRLSVAQYEAEWAVVYNRLDAARDEEAARRRNAAR
jgi:hypothetical protein